MRSSLLASSGFTQIKFEGALARKKREAEYTDCKPDRREDQPVAEKEPEIDSRNTRADKRPGRRPQWRPVSLIAAGIALDVALMDAAGFVAASAALFWLTARAFDRRHPVRDLLFGVGFSGAAYLIFARVLSLTLPAGPFARWF